MSVTAPRLRRFMVLAATVAAASPLGVDAAPVSWNVDASGTWQTPTNWTSNPALPGAADDVTIDRPLGTFTITLSAGTQSVKSLFTAEPLTLSAGTLTLGTTFQANAPVLFNGGDLFGGTLTTGVGGSIAVDTDNTVFSGVTVANTLVAVGNNDTLGIVNGLVLNSGTVTLTNSGSGSVISLTGSQAISGGGEIVFNNGAIGNAVASTLTLGSGITARTGTTSGTIATAGLVNNGTISAQTAGRSITISSAVFNNLGLLEVKNGALLDITSNLTPAQLGNFDGANGTIRTSGILTNTNNVFALTGGASKLQISGTLLGGTITAAAGALSLLTATFDGVTVAGSTVAVEDNGTFLVTNGTTLDSGTISLGSLGNDASLQINANQTIAGSGQVIFDTTTTFNDITSSPASTLTLAPGILLRTTTGNGTVATAGLINNGTISAETAARSITISSPAFANNGLVRAANGGSLIFTNTLTVAQLGAYDATGGTVRINGTLDNTGNHLMLATAANALTIDGVLKGGTLTAAASAIGLVSPTFDGVTLANTALAIGNNNDLIITNGLTLANSTITLTSSGTAPTIQVTGSQAITGTGEIVLNGALVSQPAAATLTLGAGVVVRNGTSTGVINTSGLINSGTISAQNARTLTISSPSFTNLGLLEAKTGGTLVLANALTTAQLGTFDSSGGLLRINGTLNNAGQTLTLASAAHQVALGGAFAGGTLAVQSGASFTQAAGTFAPDAVTQTGGTITLGGTQALYTLPALAITGGKTTLSGSTKVLVTGATAVSGAGLLDLTTGAMFIPTAAGTKAAAISALLPLMAAGKTGTSGITSSTATGAPTLRTLALVDNADLGLLTFKGQPTSADTLIVTQALLGDSDLSGNVDLGDFDRWFANVSAATYSYARGDFDRSGIVDLGDFDIWFSHVGAMGPLTAADGAGVASAPVPEPASLALLVPGAMLLLGKGARRRR